MSVLIAGSRKPKNQFAARIIVDEMIRQLPPGMVVLNGGAYGIDEYVRDSIDRLPHGRVINLKTDWRIDRMTFVGETVCFVFEANWKRDGKAAGIIRNLHMLDLQPEMVVVLWNGTSPGSRHVAEEAGRRGIECAVIEA